MIRLLDATTPQPYLVLDGSGLGDWLRCGQYYHCRHQFGGGGVVPADDSPTLTAGRMFHEALATRYRHGVGPVTEQVRQAMRAAVDKVWSESLVDPDWRTPDYLWQLIEAYLEAYPSEDFQVREVEAPFARRLGEVQVRGQTYGVLWQGRRDMVVAFLGAGGAEWIVDHKTASSESNWAVQWGQSTSQLGYVWSRWQFTGRKPEGFLMNICKWLPPAKTARASTPRFTFSRVPVPVATWQLEEWKETVLWGARQVLEAILSGVWPKNSDSCLKYGSRCPYWDACTLPKASRERLLATGGFRRNDWTPLAEGA